MLVLNDAGWQAETGCAFSGPQPRWAPRGVRPDASANRLHKWSLRNPVAGRPKFTWEQDRPDEATLKEWADGRVAVVRRLRPIAANDRAFEIRTGAAPLSGRARAGSMAAPPEPGNISEE